MMPRSAICLVAYLACVNSFAPGGSIASRPPTQLSVKTALDPQEWRQFTVKEITPLSHDTKKFTVALPSEEHELGMVTASCLMVEGTGLDGTSQVARPYTPTSLNGTKGHFELVIKKYDKGQVSSYMHGLSVGDAIKAKGPFPKIKLDPNMKKRLGLIAGGTGITPMYQCIQELLEADGDATEMVLLYGNKTPKDILLKSELDALAAKYPRFSVVYKVGEADDGWTGPVGHIGLEDCKQYLPPPSDDHMVFVCGPPPLMKAISGDKGPDKSQGAVDGVLKELGYKESMVYKF
eukprot:TRINITY_DN6004_c0_g1_i3.p1 TRINITY_DN6004_c0_g1~~TRINITY_DN6004_c0_g1_i3.p1  ORF type:complete len:292 (-),score=113.20 TRINITY_DN6004_c0_g1_i3:337-1212(-)